MRTGEHGLIKIILFGLYDATGSTTSHDKDRYFLEVIEHMEWGINVGKEHLGEVLIANFQTIESVFDAI